MTEISVNVGKINRSFSGKVDLGTSVQEAVDKFGEDAVFYHFLTSAKSSAKSVITNQLSRVDAETKEYTQDEKSIQKFLNKEWKLPDGTRAKKTPVEKVSAAFSALSAEERADVLKQLQAE